MINETHITQNNVLVFFSQNLPTDSTAKQGIAVLVKKKDISQTNLCRYKYSFYCHRNKLYFLNTHIPPQQVFSEQELKKNSEQRYWGF